LKKITFFFDGAKSAARTVFSLVKRHAKKAFKALFFDCLGCCIAIHHTGLRFREMG